MTDKSKERNLTTLNLTETMKIIKQRAIKAGLITKEQLKEHESRKEK